MYYNVDCTQLEMYISDFEMLQKYFITWLALPFFQVPKGIFYTLLTSTEHKS
jgi:hypothetical protein